MNKKMYKNGRVLKRKAGKKTTGGPFIPPVDIDSLIEEETRMGMSGLTKSTGSTKGLTQNFPEPVSPQIGTSWLAGRPGAAAGLGAVGENIIPEVTVSPKKRGGKKRKGGAGNLAYMIPGGGKKKKKTEGIEKKRGGGGRKILTATKKEGKIARRKGWPEKEGDFRSFDDAFAAARKEGKKEFTWRGKRYHTRTAEEEAARKRKNPPKDPMLSKKRKQKEAELLTKKESGGFLEPGIESID